MATRNAVWRWSDLRDTQRNRRAPLDRLYDSFLKAGNYSAKTKRAYGEATAVFFKWMAVQGYDGVLSELDPDTVREWQSELEAAGRSANTLRAYLSALKSFSHYLADDGITRDRKGAAVDLLASVKIPKPPKKRPETYADAEIERVLDGINRFHTQGARDSAFIRLLFDSGLRLNEACQLAIEDVDWKTGQITVRSETAKFGKPRTTRAGMKTLAELRRYVEHFRPEVPIPNLFIDRDGDEWTTNAVQCMMRRLSQKHGIHITAHKWRRSWATNFRRMGAGDLYELQSQGGWEDLDVPQKFYVDTEQDVPTRPSVFDLWDRQQQKNGRRRPVQVGKPVHVVQVVESLKNRRPAPDGTTSNAKKKGV